MSVSVSQRIADADGLSPETPLTPPCSCAVELDGEVRAYNEEGFRFFLEIERRRAALTNRSLLLMLVDITPDTGSEEMSPSLAATLFSTLASCLRETDFVGWYRDGKVAGAVLTQLAEAPGADASSEVARRVTAALTEALPQANADRVKARVFQLALQEPA